MPQGPSETITETHETYEGSCCCGRVRYRARGPLAGFTHCHCTDCRKTHGAAFASYVGVRRDRLTFLGGERELEGFTTRTGTRRSFCRHCGSSLTATVKDEPEMVYVTAGSLDTPLHRKPDRHLFVRSKVPWLELHDDLPQHREYPD